MKGKHLSYMSAIAGLLLTASCTDDISYDYEGDSSYNNEPVDVTFTITTEDLEMETRAGGPGAHQSISKGQNIDMLIYAVYMYEERDRLDNVGNIVKDSNGNPVKISQYTLMTQYGEGNIGYENNKPFKTPEKDFSDKAHSRGQTVVNVGKLFQNGGSYELTLRLMRNQTYVLALWAQNSETTAYNTNNLRLVTVNYYNTNTIKDSEGIEKTERVYSFPNNDEDRDAFCKTETFSVGAGGATRTVILKRPFAQINVGTTGADYANLIKGSYVFTNKKFVYSKITLEGVARFMDLATDRILSETDLEAYAYDPIDERTGFNQYDLNEEQVVRFKTAIEDSNRTLSLTNVTFDWAKIPAYYDMTIPTSDNDLIGTDLSPNKEEFLYVNLDNHGVNGHNDGTGNSLKFLKYMTEFPTAEFGNDKKVNKFLTETFKYLSMCYVLVPSNQTYSSDPTKPEYDFASSVLKNLKVEFSENQTGPSSQENQCYKEIPNVPVKRNWRTNILGGFGSDNNSSNSIFSLVGVSSIVHEDFDDRDTNTIDATDGEYSDK